MYIAVETRISRLSRLHFSDRLMQSVWDLPLVFWFLIRWNENLAKNPLRVVSTNELISWNATSGVIMSAVKVV